MILCCMFLCNESAIIFVSVQIWFYGQDTFSSISIIYLILSSTGDFTQASVVSFYCLLFLYTFWIYISGEPLLFWCYLLSAYYVHQYSHHYWSFIQFFKNSSSSVLLPQFPHLSKCILPAAHNSTSRLTQHSFSTNCI